MNFPQNKPFRVDPPTEALDALGVSKWDDIQYSDTNQKLLVHLATEEEGKELKPDFKALLDAENPYSWRGVVVTSRESGRFDFISRYFAPLMGVNEDPVTGSAHTVLAPYRGEILGKSKMCAYQASERGGELLLELVGERVNITGKCVTIIEGKIRY